MDVFEDEKMQWCEEELVAGPKRKRDERVIQRNAGSSWPQNRRGDGLNGCRCGGGDFFFSSSPAVSRCSVLDGLDWVCGFLLQKVSARCQMAAEGTSAACANAVYPPLKQCSCSVWQLKRNPLGLWTSTVFQCCTRA